MTTEAISRSQTNTGNAVEIASQLADEFRSRAAEYDRTGEFPTANYDRMREEGYLRALVPSELGGLGAGYLEMARAQQALARGCGSTALAVNMHHFQIGFMSDMWRRTGAAPLDNTLRRVADEGIVLGSTGAEAIVAGEWKPSTIARREGDGYRLTGRKPFVSQAPGMDVVRVQALDEETGETLICSVVANLDGVSVVETWDTTGMRATASHDLVLDNVFIPESAVGGKLGPVPMRGAPMSGVSVWFLALTSSVYLGVAEEARAQAYRALGTGVNSNSRDEVLTNTLIGQMEADYMAAEATRDFVGSHLDRDREDFVAVVKDAILMKEIVTEKAIAVVDRAVQIAGGRAFYRKSPLERLARDVRAARFHPPAAPVSYQMVGARYREALAAIHS
jgi:alkylation response protein AidB-like acyl-CoA dehydrogenase